MLLTILLLLVVFVAGFYIGAEHPSVLAKAKADLHTAKAAALDVETRLKKLRSGL